MEKIFKDNPKLDVVYKTSDNRHFYLENDAKNWASTLKDKSMTKLVRKETKEDLTVVVPPKTEEDKPVKVDKKQEPKSNKK